MALTNGRGPRLHHLAVYVATPLDIIHLCDVMATTGYLKNMERGPGRHGISNAFFLYVLDPDGHRLEIYTSDYLTVDTDLEPIRWATAPTVYISPLQGLIEWDKIGEPLYNPSILNAFTSEIKKSIKKPVQLIELDAHINDPAFTDKVLAIFDDWVEKGIVKKGL
jgi:Uncharacterised protein family (UPF0261)/Glyoxalase/Bleomycin resistance protein/Dioxygenase superfamily